MPGAFTRDRIASLPSVLLHDHLDGGLRPQTMLELAEAGGYRDLPADDAPSLAAWMTAGASRGDLLLYLDTFVHTVGVMQTPEALARVAHECVEDLAADGVVYAEVRFAPDLHTASGMAPDAVVEAVLDGFGRASAGSTITVAAIVTAMRTSTRSLEVARVARRWADRGVVAFDLAGAEAGFPAHDHRDALDLVLADDRLGLTIHAGEGDGVDSIRDALECGAQRLGHGVRIADEVDSATEGATRLGPTAERVHDAGVVLELCPSSNVHSGAARSVAAHPIGALAALGFAVTVNTDNRLMSATSPSAELALMSDAFGWGLDELERVAVTAALATFQPEAARRALVDDRIRPAFERARTGDPA